MPHMRPRGHASPKPRPGSAAKARQSRRAAIERERRRVYALVDARDGSFCRICARLAPPDTMLLACRGEHHHIVYRSRGGKDTVENVIRICLGCHNQIHAGAISVSGTSDALVVTRRAA